MTNELQSPNIDQLNEEIQSLTIQVMTLSHIIHFHGLNCIPMKYRKAFPKDNEYPFFEQSGFNKKSKFYGQITIYPSWEDLHAPEKEPDYNAAKERMKKYLDQAKKFKPPKSEES